MGLEVTADEPKPGIHTVHAKGEIDLHSVELFEDVVHEVLAKFSRNAATASRCSGLP